MRSIAICAPATPITREIAAAVSEIARDFAGVNLHFHEQCFAADGHFAGSDSVRLAAFLDCANDPSMDAVWFAKGGYGSNRITGDALSQLNEAARAKTYLGYSDMGYLLGGLYRHGIGRPVHGPMPIDLKRKGGEGAVRRVLSFLQAGSETPAPVDKFEDNLMGEMVDNRPRVAFNLMTLSMLCGTDLMPDLTGHIVEVEEVGEYAYAVDRLFFHLTQNLRGIAGLRLGRVSAVPENDRAFGLSIEEIARHWCARNAIPFLGYANIGHDADNEIVPFGLAGSLL